MKTFFKAAAALLLTVTLLVQGPARAYAQNANTKDYISEVKIAMGSGAEDALAGYTILSDEDGDAIDLNKGAGGDWGSQGDRRVILGYKTTKKQSEAITDLAVMNMKGGYDVQEYEALIRQRMDSQVIPFIRKFQTTINEYRENIHSGDDVNRARAEYSRAALNKFTDDDCGGAGLGDLLLNTTKFEMGDAAYNALSDAEKKKHCDIVTLFMQADGQMMLMIYALLTRAADTTEDESWMDRFSAITYDDLLASYDMSETDAKIQMDKDFQDDAKLVLQNWDALRSILIHVDATVEEINAAKVPDLEAVSNKAESLGGNADINKYIDTLEETLDAAVKYNKIVDQVAEVAIADYLESIEYEDGTMFDFFTQNSSDLEKNIEVLYPLVASLSEGQRAGLEFISLRELVMVGNRDTEYDLKELEETIQASVYEGVDRGIYEKGGVALTWEAKRAEALELEHNNADDSPLSTKTIVLYALTSVAAVGFIGSLANLGRRAAPLIREKLKLSAQKTEQLRIEGDMQYLKEVGSQWSERWKDLDKDLSEVKKNIEDTTKNIKNYAATTKTAAWMSAGFAAAMLILAGVSLYLTWEDMKAYYKVDFSPIPHYMVDETAITYYVNNVKMVKENHAAYYKAVSCANRTDKKYVEILGDCADLNGDVGQQWLALYACWNNKVAQPILADSLKVVVGSTDIPAGYETGIHMFGSEAAFNLNNKMYDWNQSAKSIFVYFQVDKDAKVQEASTSGSAFTGGWIALTAVLGVALGAVVTAVSMTTIRKKKERTA